MRTGSCSRKPNAINVRSRGPMVRIAIEVHLERHGFQVTIADGGVSGLRALVCTALDLMTVDIFEPPHARFRVFTSGRRQSIDRDVRLRLGKSRPADPEFLRMALEPGAAVYANGVAHGHQRNCIAEARSRSTPFVPSRTTNLDLASANKALDGPAMGEAGRHKIPPIDPRGTCSAWIACEMT